MFDQSRVPSEADRWTAIVASLTRRRITLGLSQLELDDRVGLAAGQVGKFECLKYRPTGFVLACWAEALGLLLTVVEPEGFHVPDTRPTASAYPPDQVRQRAGHARGRAVPQQGGVEALARAEAA